MLFFLLFLVIWFINVFKILIVVLLFESYFLLLYLILNECVLNFLFRFCIFQCILMDYLLLSESFLTKYLHVFQSPSFSYFCFSITKFVIFSLVSYNAYFQFILLPDVISFITLINIFLVFPIIRRLYLYNYSYFNHLWSVTPC